MRVIGEEAFSATSRDDYEADRTAMGRPACQRMKK
jgi:hypothetical protein